MLATARHTTDGLTGSRTAAATTVPGLATTQLKKQLVARPTTYLLGELDILPLPLAFDSSCAAMAQGPTNLARGLAWGKYVKEKYGAQHQMLLGTGVWPQCSVHVHRGTCPFIDLSEAIGISVNGLTKAGAGGTHRRTARRGSAHVVSGADSYRSSHRRVYAESVLGILGPLIAGILFASECTDRCARGEPRSG